MSKKSSEKSGSNKDKRKKSEDLDVPLIEKTKKKEVVLEKK